jgi:DNA-binding IclR family transcriptional regulator
MSVEPLANDEVLGALADCEATAVPTARLATALDAPKPYVTAHLQQLALQGLVGFNTHEGTRRWRLTRAAESPGRD